MELKDYVRLLRNHWRGVLTIVVLCVALGALWTATRSPIYAANANGFVTTSTTDENTSLASVNDSLAKSKATSFLQIARSRAVAERVIDDLGLTESPASLVNSIEAIQPPDTVLLQITARASTPERAVELADAWVSSLAETVEEIQNPQGRGTAPLRIMPVEAADLPSSPVSPDPVRNLALSLLVGLLLGFGYAVLRGTFDRRLMNKREIEEKFSVSVVGQIPATDLLNRGNSGNAQLAVDADTRIIGQGPASEAFRKLRTNLTYMDVDNPPRIIVVSSPMPGDGKSTVSANLVAAIERSGQSVILVDGDLRRPMVAASLGLVEGVGLTDVLTGKIGIEDALQRIPGHDGLRVLAAGPVPPNPSELLGSQAMRNLLARLSQDSIVVIDAPPLLPVTDGAILAARTDGALIVISSGKTKDHHLESALEHLNRVDAKTLGVIVNRVPQKRKVLGYGTYGSYGGYGSYGSYGGYASRTEKKESKAVTKAARRDQQPKRRLTRK
ncbi:polysaccharide biosynthesis tyrosine autokinase [Nocardioides daphniae]|uniref:Chromosome partitioning protein n=1 Tax=Nocardioides daphniae TaxID=402297 RepID=A0ABQ1Q5L9_9ACTN|nr:polysaccharide biosynthesis tyrosine autokinase [Nocardioides daphniae]GGD15092.1 chromosome partitioning protein [Nocardioides daphniae]